MKITIKIEELHRKAAGAANEILQQVAVELKHEIQKYAEKRALEFCTRVVAHLNKHEACNITEFTLELPDEREPPILSP